MYKNAVTMYVTQAWILMWPIPHIMYLENRLVDWGHVLLYRIFHVGTCQNVWWLTVLGHEIRYSVIWQWHALTGLHGHILYAWTHSCSISVLRLLYSSYVYFEEEGERDACGDAIVVRIWSSLGQVVVLSSLGWLRWGLSLIRLMSLLTQTHIRALHQW